MPPSAQLMAAPRVSEDVDHGPEDVGATRDALSGIAGRTGAWLYWYGRTATLDARQDLHRARLPD